MVLVGAALYTALSVLVCPTASTGNRFLDSGSSSSTGYRYGAEVLFNLPPVCICSPPNHQSSYQRVLRSEGRDHNSVNCFLLNYWNSITGHSDLGGTDLSGRQGIEEVVWGVADVSTAMLFTSLADSQVRINNIVNAKNNITSHQIGWSSIALQAVIYNISNIVARRDFMSREAADVMYLHVTEICHHYTIAIKKYLLRTMLVTSNTLLVCNLLRIVLGVLMVLWSDGRPKTLTSSHSNRSCDNVTSKYGVTATWHVLGMFYLEDWALDVLRVYIGAGIGSGTGDDDPDGCARSGAGGAEVSPPLLRTLSPVVYTDICRVCLYVGLRLIMTLRQNISHSPNGFDSKVRRGPCHGAVQRLCDW